MANDSGSTGILGVIVGVLLVLGIIYFAFGEKLGVRTSGPSTTVSVNAPKAPTPGKQKLDDLIKRMAIFVGAHVAFVALVMQAYAG